MISANVIVINDIVSDIAIKIEKEMNNKNNSEFTIKLGSFTGSRILSEKGPGVRIQMATIGNIDTELKSELASSGINQTLHRIYLKVDCQVSILTPFNIIEERIENQVLLTEALIIGTTPNTYYNFEGINQNEVLEVVE